jgi:predicted hydrocarbon binding protein
MPRELRAKETIGYHYNPDKKVFLVSIDLKHDPGALASISSILFNSEITPLGGFTSINPESQTGVWGFFAESKKDMRASQLKKLIDSSPYVLGSSVIEGTEEGLVVDTIHFPLKLNSGETMILARKEVFSDMFKRLGEIFGTGGETIVYEEGEATGESDGRRLIEVFGRDLALQSIPELSNLYLTLGWGRPELVKFNAIPFSATIRLYDSFECSGQKSTKPHSYFIRGHMTGLINTLFQKQVNCVERKCSALGDEYCEFSLVEKSPV